MTETRSHTRSLSTLTAPQLTDLLDSVSDELARRAHDDGAQLLPALESLGRSIARVGRTAGLGYARSWAAAPPVGGRARQCAHREASAGSWDWGSVPSPVEQTRPMTLYGIKEDRPGSRWQALFEQTWPAYRTWYLAEGNAARPDLSSCRAALSQHMPELVSMWERLVGLAGGDELAARMLSLWNPPAFAPGCAQLVTHGPARVLVRNYDYHPDLFEGVVLSSRYGSRRVIGTSDCLWGLVDGMNDDGLVVSLTYGGRPGTGEGFAIPLVVRYLLETCGTTAQARAALDRLPVAASYNLTLSDRSGSTVTVFVGPGRQPECFHTPLATNHRGLVPDDPEAARRLNSVGRQDALRALDRSGAEPDAVVRAFLSAPLHNTAYSQGFGTLYTAVYRPDEGVVDYVWPDATWRRRFESPDATMDVLLREPVGP
jgi:predicted choloylglycine hydrolase